MRLFLHEITEVSDLPRRRVSAPAVWSLIIAATGFLNVVGFIAAPVLAHIALVRMWSARRRGETVHGRWMAIAALWISYGVLGLGIGALLVMLIAAYAALPSPDIF